MIVSNSDIILIIIKGSSDCSFPCFVAHILHISVFPHGSEDQYDFCRLCESELYAVCSYMAREGIFTGFSMSGCHYFRILFVRPFPVRNII
jgi:hypothetical protein